MSDLERRMLAMEAALGRLERKVGALGVVDNGYVAEVREAFTPKPGEWEVSKGGEPRFEPTVLTPSRLKEIRKTLNLLDDVPLQILSPTPPVTEPETIFDTISKMNARYEERIAAEDHRKQRLALVTEFYGELSRAHQELFAGGPFGAGPWTFIILRAKIAALLEVLEPWLRAQVEDHPKTTDFKGDHQ